MTGGDLIYVVGTGRSGSTLVGSILGELPGVFCAGELRYLWRRGFVENRFCGCGERFADCPVWSEVAARIAVRVPPERLAAASERIVRVRRLPALLRRTIADPESAELIAHTRRAYEAIAEVTGALFVVDTSKSPAYALVLEAAGVVPRTYVHLVRDPRAAAWSWSRPTATRALSGDAEPMDRFSPRKAAALWFLWNALASARFGRRDGYAFVRYEDFTRAPREQMLRLLTTIGMESGGDDVFVDDDAVMLGPNHSVAGNPGRRRSGATTIADDDEWAGSMAASARLEVSAMTLPLMRRYGYRATLRAA